MIPLMSPWSYPNSENPTTETNVIAHLRLRPSSPQQQCRDRSFHLSLLNCETSIINSEFVPEALESPLYICVELFPSAELSLALSGMGADSSCCFSFSTIFINVISSKVLVEYVLKESALFSFPHLWHISRPCSVLYSLIPLPSFYIPRSQRTLIPGPPILKQSIANCPHTFFILMLISHNYNVLFSLLCLEQCIAA